MSTLFKLAVLLGYSAQALSPPPNVWKVFGEVAERTQSVNLGLGFPDWNPPQFVIDSLHGATSHQYTRPSGHPELIDLLASRYSMHLNRYVDPASEVAVTVGASQSLYLALITLLKPDDEIVIFEPFFELYAKQIALTKAKPVYVKLGGEAATLSDPWALDVDLLRRSINNKTKILLLNSPHNPTGKVFRMSELEAIAAIVSEFPQLIVISDEVYKYTVYNPVEAGDSLSVGHYHFARLPGMWDRTLTISSCGKTFSATGWQVGWMVGPARFVVPIHTLLPCVQFCTATPIQDALCRALKTADEPYEGYSSYYEWLRGQFARKRDILAAGLLAAGIEPLPSQGGFFLLGKLPFREDLLQRSSLAKEPYDWTFCKQLAEEKRVVGVPASPFFSSSDYYHDEMDHDLIVKKKDRYQGAPLARFAFCKQDNTLLEASRRLKLTTSMNCLDVIL